MLLMTFWYTVLVTWPCKPSERYRVRGSPKGTRDLQKKNQRMVVSVINGL